MWYECLPPFVIMGACIAVTGWGLKLTDRIFLEGKPNRYSLDKFDERLIARDERITGSKYRQKVMKNTLKKPGKVTDFNEIKRVQTRYGTKPNPNEDQRLTIIDKSVGKAGVLIPNPINLRNFCVYLDQQQKRLTAGYASGQDGPFLPTGDCFVPAKQNSLVSSSGHVRNPNLDWVRSSVF